jgi:tRNA A-37 threonylcarbamoyl transferase component Bud32
MPPIRLEKGFDGVYAVKYFDREIGWIQESRVKKVWRALSWNGDLKHTKTLREARRYLVENFR